MSTVMANFGLRDGSGREMSLVVLGAPPKLLPWLRSLFFVPSPDLRSPLCSVRGFSWPVTGGTRR
jgi:hypothetical protein